MARCQIYIFSKACRINDWLIPSKIEMREILKKHIVNIRGNRLDQRYIVFESDDWGAIRIPSISAREKLLQKKLIRENDPFSRFDSLETTEDYEALFNVLKKFKNNNGKHPVFTANFILNNPDFDKIESEDFQTYHSESFKETYNSYGGSENAWDELNKGIANKLIVPQFHGSEHLNVVRWMDSLKLGNQRYHFAFKEQCYAIDEIGSHNRRENIMATYDYSSPEELEFLKNGITKGLQQFQEIFGFASTTSIAPCYVWGDIVEKELLAGGVRGFQGSFLQNSPIPGKAFQKNYRYIGQRNRDQQYYLVRNCLFEPSIHPNINWVAKCMESINIAFKWGKPAIIGTHRINYTGRLDTSQRDHNLKLLLELLVEINKKWPEANFTDSASLLQKYTNP